MTNHSYRQRLFTELSKVPSETLLSYLIDAKRALEGSKISVEEVMEMIILDLGFEVVMEDDVLYFKQHKNDNGNVER
jgi:hypothetical protein